MPSERKPERIVTLWMKTNSVWLFTRPLSYVTHFSSSEATSEGRDHLCHWGVLVTELTMVDISPILL